jgi:hypothetical protein
LAKSSTIVQFDGSLSPLPALTTSAASGNGIEPVIGFNAVIEDLLSDE